MFLGGFLSYGCLLGVLMKREAYHLGVPIVGPLNFVNPHIAKVRRVGSGAIV